MLPETVALLLNAINLQKILILLMGVGFVFALSKGLKWGTQYLCDVFPSKKRLWLQVYTILSFPFFVISLLFVIYKGVSPPQEFILAFLGSATFAVGFALKDFVGSIISGWSIALDAPFQIGNSIKFREIEGIVTHVGLRVVKVLTLDNETITIPNAAFLSDVVLCRNLGIQHLRVTNSFYVAFSSNTNLVREIILNALHSNRFVHHKEPPTITFSCVWKADILCVEVTVKSNVINANFERAYSSSIVETVNERLVKNGLYPSKVQDVPR